MSESDVPVLSDMVKRRLLALARESIRLHLAGARLALEPEFSDLATRCGAFVTLRRRGDGLLRGCIGSLDEDRSVAHSVSFAAVAAATRDPRFPPLRHDELEAVRIEVSALGPFVRTSPEQIIVGRHGVLIRRAGHSGLLLPQVAVEFGWTVAELLDHACRKAGLEAETWRREDSEILAFTAVVFGED